MAASAARACGSDGCGHLRATSRNGMETSNAGPVGGARGTITPTLRAVNNDFGRQGLVAW